MSTRRRSITARRMCDARQVRSGMDALMAGGVSSAINGVFVAPLLAWRLGSVRALFRVERAWLFFLIYNGQRVFIVYTCRCVAGASRGGGF